MLLEPTFLLLKNQGIRVRAERIQYLGKLLDHFRRTTKVERLVEMVDA